jgi:hypothetical protein
MTTEEWGQLPEWVRTALTNAGYGPLWIREVAYEADSARRQIKVALRFNQPQRIAVTVAAGGR